MSYRPRLQKVIVSISVFSLLFQQAVLPVVSYAQDGANVVAGSAAISQQGNITNIDSQSQRTIINWNSFNVPGGHTTNFNQPNAQAAVLNRVTGANNPSSIYGTLNSNGNVFLVNPSGILVGPTGVINTNGFTASVLDVHNQEFLNGGPLHFSGNSTAGVINQGKIYTGTGGTTLIGNYVINEGLIESLGRINLIAGGSVELDGGGKYIQADAATVQNGISETAGLIKNSGTIRATGAMEVGGEVYLVAPGGKVMQEALVLAQKLNENGDAVGGKVIADTSGGAERTGETSISGAIDVSGTLGGQVVITGDSVALQGANIDASGLNGGGTVNIGGGFQGSDASIANSLLTRVDENSTINADATILGSGGQVIVWSDDTTYFAGTATVRGGAQGGDGGFVETSGLQRLTVADTAYVNALAPSGDVGDWLLDPKTIVVATGGGATLAQAADSSDTTTDITIAPATINAAAANVSLWASETITVSDAIAMTNAGVGLTMRAGNLITLNAGVSTNNGDITLLSDDFDINAAINAGTGTVMFDRVTGGLMEIAITPPFIVPNIPNIDTTELAFISAGDLVFGNPNAAQNQITGQIEVRDFPNNPNITGLVQFNALGDAGAFITVLGTQTYPSVEFNANDGVTSTSATTITTTAGDAVFNVDADATGAVGFDDLRAQDGAPIAINSAANILIIAPRYLEQGSGTITLNANSGAGTIDFRRSTPGVISVGTSGGLSFSSGALSRMTAGTINFGNTNLAQSNTTAINVNGVNLSSIGTVTFNTAGNTSFSGANSFASVATKNGTTTVNNGATLGATGTLAFNTSFVNLDGNLTAAGGISGTASTINVQGSVGGAELQDAVDVAANGATVNVAAGSYSGFTIDVENLTVDGVGDTTIVNATSPAITIVANGVTVQDLLLQGTGSANEVGILLDGTAAPGLTGISIVNVDFSNLDDGIRSQGDIGVGAMADITIRGNSSADQAIFEDFLDTAIDVGDTDADATYVIQDVIVRDGATDGDTVATGGDGFRFGAAGGITVNRVDISGATGDGIQFGALDGAMVTLSNSSIVGALDAAGSGSGLNFDGFITNGSQISIADNSRIESLGGLHGIEFEQAPTGAATTIDIANNTLIQSAENQGIVFVRGATDVTIIIRGNGTDSSNGIRGPADAISVNNNILTNVTFIVGGDTAVDGNFVFSTNQALDIEGIDGGRFVVANNDLLQGSTAVEMEGAVTNGAEVILVNNGDITSTGAGFQFRDNVTDSIVTIAGNSFTNVNGNAIVFLAGQAITDSTVNIGSATVSVEAVDDVVAGGNTIDGSGNGSGILVRAAVDGDTNFTINDNTIGINAARVGIDGIAFEGGILDTATVTIDNNMVFATQLAIDIDDLQSPSTLSIVGGTYDATGGALRVDNTGVAGTDGRLNVGTVSFVGGVGTTIFEVLTDSGNAGVDIDFQGAATLDGGATGMRLSGPGIDVLNDTFGSILFTNQTGDYITLVDGAEFLPGSPTHLDATGVSFDGTLGSAMTPAQLQALESKLTHYPDNNTLGLINTNDLFVVNGESIQLAVNAAGALGGTQTVTVMNGTFGGSVEVWVDDLTIVGQGATTIIDTDSVDPFANNGDVDNGFQVAAISATSGGGNVSGVTIDGFAFDTLSTSGMNIGVELGETGTSTAGGTTVQNSTFTDLLNGIVGYDLGGTTTLSNLDITSSGHGILFDQALSGVTINLVGNTITSTNDDGIRFSGNLTGTDVLIGGLAPADANSIQGDDSGITTTGISGGSFVVAGNTLVLGTQFSGMQVGALSNNTLLGVVGNTVIRGAGLDGIDILQVNDSTVAISGNSGIFGNGDDGIFLANGVFDSTFTVGTATVNVGGVDTAYGGNSAIIANSDAFDIDQISNSTFRVADNTLIRGTNSEGLEFDNTISNGSVVEITGNNQIEGATFGIEFQSAIDASSITIAGNSSITGSDNDGIRFSGNLTGTDVLIGGLAPADANSIQGDDSGITTTGISGGSFVVAGNTLVKGDTLDGILTGAISNNALFGVVGNNEIRGVGLDGISLLQVNDSTVAISGNTGIFGGLDDGIYLADGLFDSTFTVGTAAVNVGGVDTAYGGNGQIIGQSDGLDIDLISNSTFRVADNTLIQGTNGDGIEFDTAIFNGSLVEITGNTDILGATNGIWFRSTISDTSTVVIDSNGAAALSGADYDGTQPVDLANLVITGSITGGSGSGISFDELSGDTAVTVSRNMINGSGTGIRFGGSITSTQTTAVYNNFILGNGGHGIQFAGNITGPVAVFQNYIAGNGGDGIQIDPAADIGSGNLLVQQNFIPGAGFANGNGGFGFNRLGSGTPDLEGNWWGTITIPGINSAINGAGLPTLVLLFGTDTNTPSALGASGLDPFAFQNSEALPVDAIDFALSDNRFLTYDRFIRYQDYFITVQKLLDLTGGGSLPPTGLPGGIKFEQEPDEMLPAIIPASRTRSGYDFGGE